MASQATDTIVAVATPPGRGGIGIVRLSGPTVRQLAEALLGTLPAPRQARYGAFHDPDGRIVDRGLALFFPAPHSFTGEDVLELQGHGGPVVMDLLVASAVALGARLARPGEFSERAYLNERMDLVQAEAVADLIDSASTQAARAALHSLDGAFSTRVTDLANVLAELRCHVEASLDFSDEDIEVLSGVQLDTRLEACQQALDALVNASRSGCLLREGITLVIIGAPNVGKSSLLNALTGHERAIVTDVPGTTRDLLREQIDLDGIPVHVLDTAGLRDSADEVEQEGIRRAHAAAEKADHVLLVVDDISGPDAADEAMLARLPAAVGRTMVRNKIDLSGRDAAEDTQAAPPVIRLSAKSGAGVALLKNHLKQIMGYREYGEGIFMARRRHLEAMQRVGEHLARARALGFEVEAAELLAEELRLAHHALGEITGEDIPEDLLDRIFAGFCLGK
jgi:tRNA modification GTPase